MSGTVEHGRRRRGRVRKEERRERRARGRAVEQSLSRATRLENRDFSVSSKSSPTRSRLRSLEETRRCSRCSPMLAIFVAASWSPLLSSSLLVQTLERCCLRSHSASRANKTCFTHPCRALTVTTHETARGEHGAQRMARGKSSKSCECPQTETTSPSTAIGKGARTPVAAQCSGKASAS